MLPRALELSTAIFFLRLCYLDSINGNNKHTRIEEFVTAIILHTWSLKCKYQTVTLDKKQ